MCGFSVFGARRPWILRTQFRVFWVNLGLVVRKRSLMLLGLGLGFEEKAFVLWRVGFRVQGPKDPVLRVSERVILSRC